ncbi:hypothetical protein [Micromonospora sp. NPDC057141]
MLLRDGYVDDVLAGAEEPDWLVEQGRMILDSRAPVETPAESADERGPSVGQERAWALSQLVAHHAAVDPIVVAFRTKHLPDGLIPRTEVERWIQGHVESEGERASDITFTIPEGITHDWTGPTVTFNPPIAEITGSVSFSGRVIAYALPGDTAVRRCFVKADGVLDQLSKLGETLADALGWQPVQATVFILTGVTPMISIVRVSSPAFKVRHNVDLDWARRIKLDIDPAATPQEVLHAFEQARSEHTSVKRRSMTPKHLRLAAFACAQHSDKPWAERHRLWNEQFPEWSYPEQSNFRRDATHARYRLLYPSHR